MGLMDSIRRMFGGPATAEDRRSGPVASDTGGSSTADDDREAAVRDADITNDVADTGGGAGGDSGGGDGGGGD